MRSERKMLPIGVENFEKLRRNDMYYVDKTEIIADLLRNHGDASLITRPRRFGKTLTMDTLKTFFEIGQDASLFEGACHQQTFRRLREASEQIPRCISQLKGCGWNELSGCLKKYQ